MTARPPAQPGLFLAFEGGEGSGKTTHTQALHRRLLATGIAAVLTHEPGGTPLGDRIRELLKWGQFALSPRAELLLFAAARAQLVEEVIAPSLARGQVVVCDRYANSTVVYQGYGRGLDLADIDKANAIATGGLQPALIILLDIPEGQGLDRKGQAPRDRFEQEQAAFHHRVRQGYLRLAAADPERWLVIDATLPREEVAERIWQRVSSLLPQR